MLRFYIFAYFAFWCQILELTCQTLVCCVVWCRLFITDLTCLMTDVCLFCCLMSDVRYPLGLSDVKRSLTSPQFPVPPQNFHADHLFKTTQKLFSVKESRSASSTRTSVFFGKHVLGKDKIGKTEVNICPPTRLTITFQGTKSLAKHLVRTGFKEKEMTGSLQYITFGVTKGVQYFGWQSLNYPLIHFQMKFSLYHWVMHCGWPNIYSFVCFAQQQRLTNHQENSAGCGKQQQKASSLCSTFSSASPQAYSSS